MRSAGITYRVLADRMKTSLGQSIVVEMFEMMAVLDPRHDMARFGAEVFRATPRQSFPTAWQRRCSGSQMPHLPDNLSRFRIGAGDEVHRHAFGAVVRDLAGEHVLHGVGGVDDEVEEDLVQLADVAGDGG